MKNFSGFGFSGFDDNEHDFKETARGFTMPRPAKWLLILLAALAVLFFVLSELYHYVMEYWQIQEIGEQYTSVFWTDLWARLLTQTVGFAVIFVLITVNVFFIRRFAVLKNFKARFLQKKWPYLLLCFLLSLSISDVVGGSLYQKLLLSYGRQEFGITDPLFSQDIGYYIFSRPFLISLVEGFKSLLILLFIVSAAVYLIIFIKNGRKSLKDIIVSEKSAFFHVVVLAVVYFLLSMLTYRFSAENVLYASFGSQNEIFGAGYVEAGLWRQYYRFAPYLVLLAVLLIVLFLYKRKYILALCSAAIVPVCFVALTLVSAVVDSLVVSPNERNLQSPYIAYNMQATRQAYGLSEVMEREFDPEYELPASVVAEDDTWLAGTRIADFGATLTSYNQLQFLRKYYTFNDVDVAPYTLDGKLNVVFLAAREMNKENLDASAKSYANQIFRYTHGFGAVASPVNRVTAEGQPEFLIRDIPPASVGGMPEITQPRIYYGELTNDYVIVGGDNRELDYSEGLEDVEFTYDGEGGMELSLLKRLMFAWHYKDYRMLVSGNIDGDSRILINRNVIERVNRVAPFFTYDNDPYLLISDSGELFWIVNGYTTSQYYPYAQPYGGINYLRNSVTAVVDAYSGEVTMYLTDESDPVARAYQKIYPELFSKEPIPAGLLSHVRVPEYMFKVQAEMYQRYHVKDAGQFYDRADVWDIAHEKYQDNEISMEPYYNIMEIDGQDEMVLMLPFVVQGKHNMVGLLVQRNAEGHYGELMLYRFPKNETVYGPLQIENRIDNDPDISREMTLWGQGGSTVIRGNLLVVPFRNSLIYVEPIYITSKNEASLPELKRIVVGFGDSIAMEASLEDALRSVFAKNAGAPATGLEEMPLETEPPVTETEISDLTGVISGVLNSYDAFKSSAAGNDWKAMGEQLDRLDQDIERLRREQEKAQD
ncbi:MAG: UPF0182 family protein [Ruminococcaceae bacterium]|nr:UPF0182 family protein [Oscillospiraceae bacterium]